MISALNYVFEPWPEAPPSWARDIWLSHCLSQVEWCIGEFNAGPGDNPTSIPPRGGGGRITPGRLMATGIISAWLRKILNKIILQFSSHCQLHIVFMSWVVAFISALQFGNLNRGYTSTAMLGRWNWLVWHNCPVPEYLNILIIRSRKKKFWIKIFNSSFFLIQSFRKFLAVKCSSSPLINYQSKNEIKWNEIKWHDIS